MKVTFIIPCYNAEKIVIRNHKRLSQFTKKNKIKKKIIYINDGSNDYTLERLKKINDKDVEILNNKRNLGKSKSIINCLSRVKTNNVILIDCDLSYFEYLNKVIVNLKKNDLVSVNRKLKKSRNINTSYNLYQFSRNLISNFLSFLIEKKLKLEVKGDTQAGLKAFKLSQNLKKKKFISKYYFFDIELINFFRKKNLKIKLIPVKFEISKQSSIKIFSIKNFYILLEFIKVLFHK